MNWIIIGIVHAPHKSFDILGLFKFAATLAVATSGAVVVVVVVEVLGASEQTKSIEKIKSNLQEHFVD